MKRLAILSTHPIQYNAPLFRMLAQEKSIDLKVFYSKKTEQVRFDKDFGQEITWDVPLTDGYVHESFDANEKTGRTELMTAIESFNPNALLVYGWNFYGHLAAMRHFHGSVPVWFRGDSTLLDPLPFWKQTLRKISLSWVYRFVDRAFYVGQANKRYFLWCGLREDQLTCAPHAVDNAFFMADDEQRKKEAIKIRNELGIDSEATVFLFAGKLESKKQPVELAEAFESIKAQAHLIYVGSGVLEAQLKQRFESNPNIHFVGFQNQSKMPIWYRVADVFCLPSRGPGETWGLAVNEALACGCKVIVSDRVGCAEDLVYIQKCCAVVDAEAPSNWQTTMQRMAERIQSPSSDRSALIEHILPFNFAVFALAITKNIHE
jgi:glycosyltransferase involved in cell wall biosynthesis